MAVGICVGLGVGLWSRCSGIGIERWSSAFFVREGVDLDKWHGVFREIVAGLPNEENEQCSTAKYRAEFPGIGSRSPERKQTRGGLGDWRHSQSDWKPE